MCTPVYSPHPWGSPLPGQLIAVQHRPDRILSPLCVLTLPELAGILTHLFGPDPETR
jgi:hypothetical protein